MKGLMEKFRDFIDNSLAIIRALRRSYRILTSLELICIENGTVQILL